MASVTVVRGSMYTASMVPGRSELHVSEASTSSLYCLCCCCCMTSLARSREAAGDAFSSDGVLADSRATRSSCKNIACDRFSTTEPCPGLVSDGQPGVHLLGDTVSRQFGVHLLRLVPASPG
eukprot:scaffold93974_cov60-Phaeocystis_antarctica.AAC.1